MLCAAKEETPALPVIWGESVLPLAADPALLENRIWGKSLVAENSRQGFELRSSTLRWASSEVKSRTALGMRGTLYDEGIRSRCTGKERDSESGLDNFGARYNASPMGRFMSPDPLMASAKVWDPQTWNRYAYVLNNPLKYTDPTGMGEVTADQCAKDSNCVTVNVNVIYDKNANDGKGLTNDQKSAFEKGQLQNAKDQYGDADIHLNVTYTAGGVSSDNGKTYVSGLQAGALNVVVTDQIGTASSGMAGKTAVSFINANSTNNEDLPHEMAHQFMGDTQGVMNWISSRDPSYISGIIFNAVSDVANDAERAWMRNVDRHSGPLSYYPLASAFHHNAAAFQKSIQPTTQPQ